MPSRDVHQGKVLWKGALALQSSNPYHPEVAIMQLRDISLWQASYDRACRAELSWSTHQLTHLSTEVEMGSPSTTIMHAIVTTDETSRALSPITH